MRRLQIPDAETFIAAIHDELARTPQGRYFHRLHVVLSVLQGASTYDAAHVYGHSPRTVQYWVHRLLDQGLAGLGERPRPGRPRRLTARAEARVRQELEQAPRALGYDQTLWDGPLLAHHIEAHYGVRYSVRHCQRLFHQLGFSLQRPRRQAAEADPDRQTAFKKTSHDG